MIRCEDLCQSCLYFDLCDHECELGHYLEESVNGMFTYECEDYEAKEDEV